jgi:hypothetical protein
MIPSLPIRHRSDTRHSRRVSNGIAPACVDPSDWPESIANRVAQHAVHSFTPASRVCDAGSR